MCGIAGIHELEQPDRPIEADVLDRMTDALAHRGPDGRGTIVLPSVGLGHRRLAIIDLSDGGRQPRSALDGRVWITYNGELYNYRELKVELEKRGHEFESQSDTEVLLHSYLEWGLECVDHLNGIFAFGLWDARFHRLWLVRDPLGVKPLFYSVNDGQLSFASEIHALWRNPRVSREVDPEGVDAFFTFSYVPAPLTGYRRIRQLLPGEWLVAERDSLRFRKYWDLQPEEAVLTNSNEELVEEFGERLHGAVRRQLVADVPVGCFLSGGVDSFAVARAAREASPGGIKAFSMGFRESSYDEVPHARIAAESLDVDFRSGYVLPVGRDVWTRIAGHAQEPFADSSMLPVYLLSEMTRRDVKVALSGDGSDELLAGYPTYRASRAAPWFRVLPAWVRHGVIPSAASRIPSSGKRYNANQVLNRFIHGANQGEWRDHASWRVITTDEVKRELYSHEFWDSSHHFDPIGMYVTPMRRVENVEGRTRLDAWLYADLTFYLPNDMLVKVDRMSMAHGLEVRVPFLDRELVEFCWRLPNRLKLKGSRGKRILRLFEERHYPKPLAKLPKKGFNVPLESWFREDKIELGESMRTHPFVDLLDPDGVKRVVAAHRAGARDLGHVLYCLFLLGMLEPQPELAETRVSV